MFQFKGFTEKANRALNLAVESAQDLGHDYIGSEHLMLGRGLYRALKAGGHRRGV